MEVSFDKNLRDGRAEYTITGTYGPLKAGSGGGGRLVFHTDQEGMTFTLPVVAFVVGPLRFEPGEFLSFGMIPKGQAATRSVTVEPTDSFDLRVETLEARELSFDARFLELTSQQGEKSVQVTLRILPGIPAGTVVRGDVVVHLNHPAAKTRTILFNGFVR